MDADITFVPKMHPLARAVETDDPMEVIANPVHGDPDLMLESIVEEYAHMGWDAGQLMMLFRSPYYPLLNELMHSLGEKETRRRIESHMSNCGVFRFRETIAEDEEPADHDHDDLVQIGVRTSR
jgi:hypothetical protein